MTYQYRGTETLAAAERRRQQLQAELHEARQAYKAAQKLARENQRIEEQILRTQQRTVQLTTPATQLPPPRYGGPEGLLAAAREAQGHDPKRATRRAA